MDLEQLNAAIKKHDLELVIGLETHVRLNTKPSCFVLVQIKKLKHQTQIYVRFVPDKWAFYQL